MTGESADRHYFVFYDVRNKGYSTRRRRRYCTKANLIIRILNPKPKPDVYDCISILYRLYVFYSIYIFITWDVVSSN